MEYFKENIANVLTAEELVADRQLFKVALGAFGLDSEIDKRFFMQKILKEGTESSDALAIRFTDPRYRQFSEAFGFGNALGPRTGEFDFAQRITDAYKERQYEAAVGDQDTNLRLALGFKREIADLAELPGGEAGAWFSILGSIPLRTVFDTAFGLPTEFRQLDIDRQRELLEDRAQDLFGTRSVSAFQDPENVDTLINRFLVRAQAELGPTSGTPGFAALTLLQNGNSFSAIGQINLILSNSN
ncbi:MAG: DUF1217 domain-containing protein [Pseudomonadota bacterium]